MRRSQEPSGSRTEEVVQPIVPVQNGHLTLQPESEPTRRQVRWTEDVVDNENMNKKKSKICCIFSKRREFGESSSDESDSDSDSASGSDSDSDTSCHHDHSHEHSHEHNHTNGHSHQRRRKQGAPNAYERQPKFRSSGSTVTVTQD